MWDITDWIEEFTRPGTLWYLKRLSANDVQANGSHQAGPYIPKQALFQVIPSLNRPADYNPRVEIDCTIDSHPSVLTVAAIWYNNLWHGRTRNETRLTRFGGADSPLLNPEATGALAAFVFQPGAHPPTCNIWVCDDDIEADLIEERFGPVEPGEGRLWPDLLSADPRRASCWLEAGEISPEWLSIFPTGADIIQRVAEMRPERSVNVDLRLINRRKCEFELFRSVEQATEFPRVKAGYANMRDFLDHAQSVLQRRKARSGNSLQLHVRQIFAEEALREGRDFAYNQPSEAHKRPDFLFPNAAAYHDALYPESKLRMLAVKTTLRDRWRQVLNEADRIDKKHLLTLQEGVSENQFEEMRAARVQLVVPAPLHKHYRRSLRSSLQTLENFLGEIRALNP